MARSRNIKPGFFKNEELAECPFEARLLFAGLWMLADREGRLEDRPKRIKGELFAFDALEVEPLLKRLEAHGFVQRYRNADGRFIQIPKFAVHQTPHYSEKPSVIKPPGLQESPPHDGPSTPGELSESPTHDDHPTPGELSESPTHDEAPTPGGLQEDSEKKGVMKEGSQPPDSPNPDSPNPEPLFPDSPNPDPATKPRRKSATKVASVSSADADSSAKPTVPCPYKEIYALYHAKLPELPRVTLTEQESRHKAMRKFWAFVLTSKKSDGTRRAETSEQALQWIGDYFERASTNDFLMGRGDPGSLKHANWRANFDFLLTERGMKHVIENTRVPRGETG